MKMKVFRIASLFLLLVFSAFLAPAANAANADGRMSAVEISADIVNVPDVKKHKAKKTSASHKKPARKHNAPLGGGDVVKNGDLSLDPVSSAIKKSIHSLLPGENIGVEMVSHTVALTGIASSAEVAARALKIADEFVNSGSSNHKILNLMQLRSGQQVMLKVKVGEMKRSEMQKLGFGLQGILSGGEGFFGALEGKGVFKTLAEPTLTAVSGESAKFLAGGEFPVPIAQANNTMSVDYKKFGVSVDFSPIVISENRVRLRVASEVSELSDAGAVRLNNISIPSIATRRANTTVELAPGESFMIAGLIKNNTDADLEQVPGLGSIPILNMLFKSAEFKRHETELVIAVTPYMAAPLDGKDLKLPVDGYAPPSMMDMFVFGKMQGSQAVKKNSGLEGPSGFTID